MQIHRLGKHFATIDQIYIRSILSNRTVTSIISDCYIREYYKPGLFELDPVTRMTRRKSDPFDPDIRIDPTRLQRCAILMLCANYVLRKVANDRYFVQQTMD